MSMLRTPRVMMILRKCASKTMRDLRPLRKMFRRSGVVAL